MFAAVRFSFVRWDCCCNLHHEGWMFLLKAHCEVGRAESADCLFFFALIFFLSLFYALWKAYVSDGDSERAAEHHQVWLKLQHQLTLLG